MKLHIADMLRAQGKHISFHTPGHKRAGKDITELSYSDNLCNPTGVLQRAEKDIAEILHAEKSYLLTDGSTAGIFAMVYALKAAGIKKLALPVYSHASVKHACAVMDIVCVEFAGRRKNGIPVQPTAEEINGVLEKADALFLTSPDYYGFFAPLREARSLCDNARKPFVVDGAHGAHLHGTPVHAGLFADMWVDGVHKSLPALTQGAVVSANGQWGELLGEGVKLFRTSSPSYPIMASVEYAVKYPRNEKIEAAARECKRVTGAVENDDWSKVVLAFGVNCSLAQRYLEERGLYPEFNDGNYLMFYLSPCTKLSHLKKLVRLVSRIPRGVVEDDGVCLGERGEGTAWVPLNQAIGRTCAKECGLFPPCVPLLLVGQKVSAEAVQKLSGGNTFGLNDGNICVYTEA